VSASEMKRASGTPCSRGNYAPLKTSSKTLPRPQHRCREAGSCMDRKRPSKARTATGIQAAAFISASAAAYPPIA